MDLFQNKFLSNDGHTAIFGVGNAIGVFDIGERTCEFTLYTIAATTEATIIANITKNKAGLQRTLCVPGGLF